jgi:hypothetical protein
MKANFNKSYWGKIYFFLIISCLFSGKISAQQQDAPPFSYSPNDTLAHLIWTDPSASTMVKYKNIVFTDLFTSTIPRNGIMIEFDFNLINAEANQGKPVLECFSDSDRVIAFYYTNKTLFVRRWKSTNIYYDYGLYDQLFESTEGTYKMKFYLTAHFIFMVSKKIGTNNNYISSLLFGLNIPGINLMNEYRHPDSPDSYIKVGDNASSPYAPYIANIKLYSFRFRSLFNDIQNGFSAPPN